MTSIDYFAMAWEGGGPSAMRQEVMMSVGVELVGALRKLSILDPENFQSNLDKAVAIAAEMEQKRKGE